MNITTAFSFKLRVFVIAAGGNQRWMHHHVFDTAADAAAYALRVQRAGRINTQYWRLNRQDPEFCDVAEAPANLITRWEIYTGAIINHDRSADEAVATFGEWVAR